MYLYLIRNFNLTAYCCLFKQHWAYYTMSLYLDDKKITKNHTYTYALV